MMGLIPLEFRDCITDSPSFRDSIRSHEIEIERTNVAIKSLIKESKNLIEAAHKLSKAQKGFSQVLTDFKFECIGDDQTEEEIIIAESLREFGNIINRMEEQRERMLQTAWRQLIVPMDTFRKQQIGGAREEKKKFDRFTERYCTALERHLSLSAKRKEQSLMEADVQMEREKQEFYRVALEYVFKLQEVQERKKFEFVETLLAFMYSWQTFYHHGYEVVKDYQPYLTDLQQKIQNTRERYNSTRDESEILMKKILENPELAHASYRQYVRQGYLYIQEKRAIGTAWTKYYCLYNKDTKAFTMVQFNQLTTKISSNDTIIVNSCTRRMSESIEKRFCFDITSKDKFGVLTLQALSEEDRRLWLEAMDGKEPIYMVTPGSTIVAAEGCLLNEHGAQFVKKCISAVESRGLGEEGLYRVVGSKKKVDKLMFLCVGDPKKGNKVNLDDNSEWEIRTITSALKSYYKRLPEPITSHDLHEFFIASSKCETREERVNAIHYLVHQLPENNIYMLKLLINHLNKVAGNCDQNRMTVMNIGVCFGPTLLRPMIESVAAIMSIKFSNIVVEILIANYETIFLTDPPYVDMQMLLTPSGPENNVNADGWPITPTSKDPPSFPTTISSNNTQVVVTTTITTTTTTAAVPAVVDKQMVERRVKSLNAMGKKPPRPSTLCSTGISNVKGSGDNLYSGSSSSCDSVCSKSSGTTQSSASSPPTGRKTNHKPDSSNVNQAVSSSVTSGIKSASSSVRPHQHHTAPSSLVTPSSGASVRRPEAFPTPLVKNSTSDHNDTSLSKSQSMTPSPSDSSLVCPTIDPKMAPMAKISTVVSSSDTDSPPNTPTPPSTPAVVDLGRCVTTLFSCAAENDSELSFQGSELVTNVRPSKEPGWLEGTINGKTGLIPANYVKEM